MSDRTYGIEIEVAGLSEEQAYLALKFANVSCVDPRAERSSTTKWHFHNDNSIRDLARNIRGDSIARTCEIVSPILKGSDGFKQIRKVTNALTKFGASVNASTGLHVHFGARSLAPKEIYKICERYSQYSNEIDTYFHHKRRADSNNQYCSKLTSYYLDRINWDKYKAALEVDIAKYKTYTIDYIRRSCHCRILSSPCEWCVKDYANITNNTQTLLEQVSKSDWTTASEMCRYINTRYLTVNLQAYNKHGTIEFRQHHGTLNPEQIVSWIRFLDNFINVSCKMTQKKTKDFGPMHGLDTNIKKHFLRRTKIRSKAYKYWA